VCLLTTGCGGVRLVPVEGKILVDNEVLQNGEGSVVFKPDAAKGNTSTLEPGGVIESDGKYKMYTNQKPGAPLGWYKVIATATEPPDPKNPSATRKSLISPKYVDEKITDLAVEVVDNPAAGAYDLRMKKPEK
jgi:hypothetical protein